MLGIHRILPQLEADLRSQHLSQDVTTDEPTAYGQKKKAIRATLVGRPDAQRES